MQREETEGRSSVDTFLGCHISTHNQHFSVILVSVGLYIFYIILYILVLGLLHGYSERSIFITH
jgi:hypothetical protein